MEKSDFSINDEVVVVDLSDPSVLNADDMRKGDLRVGDTGYVVDFRERTVRVKLHRNGLKRNFLPNRLAKAIGKSDYIFVWVSTQK